MNDMALHQPPRVSVIMGMFNCAETLPLSIVSILNQTHRDMEIVLYDDGSTDETYSVAESFSKRDPRIILLRGETNRGLAHALNRCLRVARGEYLARMDADDVCSPWRIRLQTEYLDAHHDIDIVSTAIQHFDTESVWGVSIPRARPEYKDFVHGTPFAHPAAMVRRSAYDRVGGYPEDRQYWRVEDFALWIAMYRQGSQGANLEAPLYGFRDDRAASRRRSIKARMNEARLLAQVARDLKTHPLAYMKPLRPIILGMLPVQIYEYLHRARTSRYTPYDKSLSIASIGQASPEGWVTGSMAPQPREGPM